MVARRAWGKGLVFDARPLDDAVAGGDARAAGDTIFLKRLLAAFDDHRSR